MNYHSLEIERPGVPDGRRVSFSTDTLAAYWRVSPRTTQQILSRKMIRSEGPVHSTDPGGLQSYLSSDVNAVRDAIRMEIRAGVIAAAGTQDDVGAATQFALAEQEKNFGAKLGRRAELSQRFNGDEDEPGTIRQGVKVAAAGSAAYLLATWLRGRGKGLSTGEAVRRGHQANAADVRAAGSWLKPRLAGAASASAGLLTAGAMAAKRAAGILRR